MGRGTGRPLRHLVDRGPQRWLGAGDDHSRASETSLTAGVPFHWNLLFGLPVVNHFGRWILATVGSEVFFYPAGDGGPLRGGERYDRKPAVGKCRFERYTFCIAFRGQIP